MYDLCIVYNGDADVWPRYVQDHLGQEQFRLRILSVTDLQLVSWMDGCDAASQSSVVDDAAPSASTLLAAAADSKAFIVVASPGHVRVLEDNPQFDYRRLVLDPRTAQLLLWGIELSEICGPPHRLSSRFWSFDDWVKVTPDRHDLLLKNALAIIESDPFSRDCDESFDRYIMNPQQQQQPPPHYRRSQRQILSSIGRRTSVPDDEPPPLPPHGGTGRRSTGRSSGVSTASGSSRRRLPREFQIQPPRARCEEATTILLLFDEIVGETSTEAGVDVILGDVMSEMCVKTSADWLNPYTYMFTAPVHGEGSVSLKVLVDGVDIGDSQLVYYSLSADIVTGISQIFLQPLDSLLAAVLDRRPGGPSGRATAGGRGATLPRSTAAPTAATGAVWTVAAVDRLVTAMFDDDDECAGATGQSRIPSQAFEQLFGIYGQSGATESPRYDCPTLLHLAARHNLLVLASRLVDLPDARLACDVQDSRGRRADEIANELGHQPLAGFLANFRLMGEGVDLSNRDREEEEADLYMTSSVEDLDRDIYYNNSRDETYMDMSDTCRIKKKKKKSKKHRLPRLKTCDDINGETSDTEQQQLQRQDGVLTLTFKTTVQDGATSVESAADRESMDPGSDYEKMDVAIEAVMRATTNSLLSPDKLDTIKQGASQADSPLSPDTYFFLSDLAAVPGSNVDSKLANTAKQSTPPGRSQPQLPPPPGKLIKIHERYLTADENDNTETYLDMSKMPQPEPSMGKIIRIPDVSQYLADDSESYLDMSCIQRELTDIEEKKFILGRGKQAAAGGGSGTMKRTPVVGRKQSIKSMSPLDAPASSASHAQTLNGACNTSAVETTVPVVAAAAAATVASAFPAPTVELPAAVDQVNAAGTVKVGAPVPVNTDTAGEAMSKGQRELIDIMKLVKTKELSVNDAETMFTEWKMRYDKNCSKSFKHKQEQLTKLRQEISTEKQQQKKKSSTFRLKLPNISRRSHSLKTSPPTHNCLEDGCCTPIGPNTTSPTTKQFMKVKLIDGAAASCDCATAGPSSGTQAHLHPPQQRNSSTSNSSRESDESRTSGVADIEGGSLCDACVDGLPPVDEDSISIVGAMSPEASQQVRRRGGRQDGGQSTFLVGVAMQDKRKSRNMELLEENLLNPDAPRPPPLPPRPRKLSITSVQQCLVAPTSTTAAAAAEGSAAGGRRLEYDNVSIGSDWANEARYVISPSQAAASTTASSVRRNHSAAGCRTPADSSSPSRGTTQASRETVNLPSCGSQPSLGGQQQQHAPKLHPRTMGKQASHDELMLSPERHQQQRKFSLPVSPSPNTAGVGDVVTIRFVVNPDELPRNGVKQ